MCCFFRRSSSSACEIAYVAYFNQARLLMDNRKDRWWEIMLAAQMRFVEEKVDSIQREEPVPFVPPSRFVPYKKSDREGKSIFLPTDMPRSQRSCGKKARSIVQNRPISRTDVLSSQYRFEPGNKACSLPGKMTLRCWHCLNMILVLCCRCGTGAVQRLSYRTLKTLEFK